MKHLATIILLSSALNISFGQLHIGLIRGDSLRQNFIDTVYGSSFSLLAKNEYDVINGIDCGLISNEANSINGLSFGTIYNEIGFLRGVGIGGVVNNLNKGGVGFISSAAFNKIRSSFCGVSFTGGVNYFSNRYSNDCFASGIIIAGISNKIETGKVQGFVISSIYNRLGNKNYGVVISGLYNSYRNSLTGISVAAFGNNVSSVTKGLLIGSVNKTTILKGCSLGLYNTDTGATGMKIGLVNVSANYGSKGFIASAFANYSYESKNQGLYITGGVNMFNDFSGLAIAGIGSLFDSDFRGVAITPGVNLVYEGKGVLIAGLMNHASDFNGLSISLLNIGKSTYQLGLINISKSSKVQIGLLNFNKKSKVKLLPIFNMSQKKK
jgi:hypothetical protein